MKPPFHSKPDGALGEHALPNENQPGRVVSPKPPLFGLSKLLSETSQPPTSGSPTNGAPGERALPVRRKLPHEIPHWVKDGAIYFITINCAQRGPNQLTNPAIADAIEQSLLHRQSMYQWWIHLFLLMPDHVHGLVSFGREFSMRHVISDWKRYLSRHHAIEWQRDFFDHRIRDDASLTEKWHYIRNNPVRQNLVSAPE
ncbi:MAG: transposase [Puniceicoccales bacterium]|jgi:REP element-mobilizing transposase RayT|nr:transposase [Puniceicoccales bacterium]